MGFSLVDSEGEVVGDDEGGCVKRDEEAGLRVEVSDEDQISGAFMWSIDAMMWMLGVRANRERMDLARAVRRTGESIL